MSAIAPFVAHSFVPRELVPPVDRGRGRGQPRRIRAHVWLGEQPERAEALEALYHMVGNPRVTLDLEWIDLGLQELAQGGQEALALLDGRWIELRLRMDQVQTEVAEEQLLAEARELPLRFARRLGDLASLSL